MRTAVSAIRNFLAEAGLTVNPDKEQLFAPEEGWNFLGFSYREPGWIRKKIFRQIATFTVRIGEPIFPNAELNPKDRERDLTERCHDAVCRLADIDSKENLYPAVFNHSERIDYYTSVYGVGYKGSH